MNKKLALLGVFCASLFFVGLIVGVINTLLLIMDETVVTTGMSSKEMASLITQRLVPGAQFIIISGVTFTLSTVILVTVSYRSKWYFWCMFVFSLPYLIWVPAGTVLSIVVYAFLILKRREFLTVYEHVETERSA